MAWNAWLFIAAPVMLEDCQARATGSNAKKLPPRTAPPMIWFLES